MGPPSFMLTVAFAVLLVPSADGTSRAAAGAKVNAELATRVQMASELRIVAEAHILARRLLMRKEPRTLKDYCSGGGEDPHAAKAGAQVMSDWKGYGSRYKATIVYVHKDGSVDVSYDDGFTENRVQPDKFEVIPSTEEASTEADNPKDDPVCKMQEFVDDINLSVEEAFKMLEKWQKQQRAQDMEDKAAAIDEKAAERKRVRDAAAERAAEAEEKRAEEAKERAEEKRADEEAEERASDKAAAKKESKDKPKAAPAAAPSAAPAVAAPASGLGDELAGLKRELEDKDEQIRELEAQFLKNDEELNPEEYEDTPKTVDDLIAEYKARIHRRDKKIEELQNKLKAQEEALKAQTSGPVTLDDIKQLVDDISVKCDEVRARREKLEGDHDAELRHIVDEILEAEQNLQKQLAKLIALKHEADARRAAARAMAEKDGSSGDVAAAAAVQEADEELLAAAENVEVELRGVKDGTQGLDQDVIPHGEKWWRYRWEHAYVEAVLMIIVSILFLLWERFYYTLRSEIWRRTDVIDNDMVSHGTMYVRWLEFFAGEIMVSLFVFITVWVISQAEVWDYLPLFFARDQGLHLPKTGNEYRRLALDICVILAVAIIFYFFLMLSVVYATTVKLNDWKISAHILGFDEVDLMPRDPKNKEEWQKEMDSRWFVSTTLTQYQAMRTHWDQHKSRLLGDIHNNTASPCNRSSLQNASATHLAKIDGAREHFPPFWKYLRVSVRQTNDVLFRFGFLVWTGMILTFAFFCVCHRFAHVGYIRIMSSLAFLNILGFAFMTYMIWKLKHTLHRDEELGDDEVPMSTLTQPTWNINERHFCAVLHFFMFLMCYGASRMVCQPFMWELHFWTVLALSVLMVFIAIVFICFIAPLFPKFAAALAMPPYMDEDNLFVLSTLCEGETLKYEYQQKMITKKEYKRRKLATRDEFTLIGKHTHV